MASSEETVREKTKKPRPWGKLRVGYWIIILYWHKLSLGVFQYTVLCFVWLYVNFRLFSLLRPLLFFSFLFFHSCCPMFLSPFPSLMQCGRLVPRSLQNSWVRVSRPNPVALRYRSHHILPRPAFVLPCLALFCSCPASPREVIDRACCLLFVLGCILDTRPVSILCSQFILFVLFRSCCPF